MSRHEETVRGMFLFLLLLCCFCRCVVRYLSGKTVLSEQPDGDRRCVCLCPGVRAMTWASCLRWCGVRAVVLCCVCARCGQYNLAPSIGEARVNANAVSSPSSASFLRRAFRLCPTVSILYRGRLHDHLVSHTMSSYTVNRVSGTG